MQLPRWYTKSGTIDLDELEAQALPFRRRLVDDKKLLPPEEVSNHWAARSASNPIASGFFTVEVDGRPYAPAFFLDAALDARALEEIIGLIGELPGWSKFHFLTSKNASLGGATPLDALKDGKLDRTARAAKAFAEL